MLDLRDWNTGNSNRERAHLQEPVEAIRELQHATAGAVGGAQSNNPAPVEVGLAKIVSAGPNGEADFTTSVYWIQRLLMLGGKMGDAVTVAADATDQLSYNSPPNIFPATNWPERQAGSHALPTGGTIEVMYFAFYDAGSPQQKHYLFYRAAPEVARFQVTAINTSGLNLSYLLAKQYGSDGVTLSGPDTPILRRGAHFVGQDILAIRLANGVTAYANDPTIYPQTAGPATSPYNVTIQWEEVRGPQIVLCYHFVPFAGEGSSRISYGGWYDAYMRPEQQVLPTAGDFGLPSEDSIATDMPCVFFNWIEQGMGGVKFRGSGGHFAMGVIAGYTSTTPPVPIVYAIGSLPAGGASTKTGALAWNRATDGGFSDITVVTDASLSGGVLTLHKQTLTWTGYGWVFDKTAQT